MEDIQTMFPVQYVDKAPIIFKIPEYIGIFDEKLVFASDGNLFFRLIQHNSLFSWKSASGSSQDIDFESQFETQEAATTFVIAKSLKVIEVPIVIEDEAVS